MPGSDIRKGHFPQSVPDLLFFGLLPEGNEFLVESFALLPSVHSQGVHAGLKLWEDVEVSEKLQRFLLFPGHPLGQGGEPHITIVDFAQVVLGLPQHLEEPVGAMPVKGAKISVAYRRPLAAILIW